MLCYATLSCATLWQDVNDQKFFDANCDMVITTYVIMLFFIVVVFFVFKAVKVLKLFWRKIIGSSSSIKKRFYLKKKLINFLLTKKYKINFLLRNSFFYKFINKVEKIIFAEAKRKKKSLKILKSLTLKNQIKTYCLMRCT